MLRAYLELHICRYPLKPSAGHPNLVRLSLQIVQTINKKLISTDFQTKFISFSIPDPPGFWDPQIRIRKFVARGAPDPGLFFIEKETEKSVLRIRIRDSVLFYPPGARSGMNFFRIPDQGPLFDEIRGLYVYFPKVIFPYQKIEVNICQIYPESC
jgi:hypothetical protein